MKTTEKMYTIELTEDQLQWVKVAMWRASNAYTIDALKASNKKNKDWEKIESYKSMALKYRNIQRNITEQAEN